MGRRPITSDAEGALDLVGRDLTLNGGVRESPRFAAADPTKGADMTCIVSTARGAVWGEHVAGIGVGADGTLQLLTRQGHSHPLPASYHGHRIAAVTAALLAAIDSAVRSSVRDNRLCTVIGIDDDLVLHLDEYLAATWQAHRRTKIFTVARVAAGNHETQPDDETPPDPTQEAPTDRPPAEETPDPP